MHPQRDGPFTLDPRRQRDSGFHFDDMGTGVLRHEVLSALGGSCHLGRRKDKTILPPLEMGRTSLRRCRLERSSTQNFLDVTERENLNELRKLCSHGELSALSFVDDCDLCDRHVGAPRQGRDDSSWIWQLGVCGHTGFSSRVPVQATRAGFGRLCDSPLTQCCFRLYVSTAPNYVCYRKFDRTERAPRTRL